MVDPWGWKRGGQGVNILWGQFPIHNMKRVMKMDGGDGCTTL